MRILHCSDFHLRIDWFRWLLVESERHDLVCLTGDMLDQFGPEPANRQIGTISRYLARVKCPLALCSGNHDRPAGNENAEWLRYILRPSGCWSDGDSFTLHGHVFRCIGWGQPLPPAGRGEIWLMHAPPEACATGMTTHGPDQGDFLSGELCRAGQGPRLLLSGHVHEPAGWHARVGRTWSFNPGYSEGSPAEPNRVIIDPDRNFAFRVRCGPEGQETSEPVRLG